MWRGWWWGVRRVRFRSALACVFCFGIASRAAGARAGLAFPSVVERITGTRIDVAPVRASLGDDFAAWRIELGDTELYGIPGLRTSGARVSGVIRRAVVSGSVVSIASPVGTHARAVVEAGATIGQVWQGAVRAGVERLELDENPPETWHAGGLVSRIDVGCVTALADIDVVAGPGWYDTSLSISTRVRAGAAQLVGTMRIDGDRFVGAGVSVVARLHGSLALLAGYDDGAGSMRAGAVIGWRHVEIATGVFQHPVLGMSQGVSISCFR